MNTYNKILDLFKGNDEYRSWMMEPFTIGDKIFATDAHSLVAIDSDKVDLTNVATFPPSKLQGVYPVVHNMSKVISFDQLSEYLKLVPIIDELEDRDDSTECPECGGEGEVEYVYVSKSGKEYYEDTVCPICKGDGFIGEYVKIKTGRKIHDPSMYCKIGESIFQIKQIIRVYETMILLGNKDLTLLYQENPMKLSLFLVDDIEIIVMPCMDFEGQDIRFSI